MDYSNMLYYNQLLAPNNDSQDPLMSNYYYHNNANVDQYVQCQYQYQQIDASGIKQEFMPMIPASDDFTNVLQDDNFSIASYNVPEFTVANASPTFSMNADMTSSSAMYYPSNLSPQLSECCSSTSSYSYNMCRYQTDPVFIDSLFPAVVEDPANSKKKRKTNTISADKRHICPVCNHRSKRKHNLVEHMLTHNPHRPKSFLCGHCARPFARKYDMKRHEKIHTRSL